MKDVRLLTLLALCVPLCASAGDASRLTLQLSGNGMSFTTTINGLPVGPERLRAENLVFGLDAFVRPRHNEIRILIERAGETGSAGVILQGPVANRLGLGEAPQLARYACNPIASADVPGCEARHVVEAAIELPDSPDLRLWHADAVAADAEVSERIAETLARLNDELVRAAGVRDWDRLYYLTAVRRADMIEANPDEPQNEAAMARAIAAAASGPITAEPPPAASDLAVVALPGHLWSVRRADGRPLLRISLAPARAGTMDPEAFGDLAERWSGGVVQVSVAIFGMFDGRWELAR